MSSSAAPERQLRNAAVYFLPVVVGAAIPLITLPVFTRILSREDYGAWALATAYALFATGIANFGLTIGYERNFFENREEPARSRLLYSTIAFVMAAFIVAGLLTWIFRVRIADHVIGSASYTALLMWTLVANAVTSLKAYFLIYFRNSGDARSHVWYTVDESVLAAVLSLVFVAGLKMGIVGLVFGQLLASSIVVSALAVRFGRTMRPGFSRPLLQDALRISYPLTPRILLGVAGNQLDKYLLGVLASTGGVGVYAIGQRFAHIVFTAITALENVFAPHVYEQMFRTATERRLLREESDLAVGTYLTPFAYASVAVALAVALFAEELIQLLTAPAFHEAIPIASILALHYAIMFFGKLPQLVYAKKTGLISLLTLFSLAASAALNILFIRRWAAEGAAWGTLAAGLVSIALVLVAGQRYYPIRWQYSRLTAIFGFLFGSVVLALWLRDIGVPYAPRLAVRILLFVIYLGIGAAIGVLTREALGVARLALGGQWRPREIARHP